MLNKESNNKYGKTMIILSTTILLTIIILLSAYIVFGSQGEASNEPVINPVSDDVSSDKTSSENLKPKPQKMSVRLIGVGDDLIHEGIYSQARKRAGGKGYDFEFAYKEMEEIIKLADIASINQETMLADIYEPSSYPFFNSPTQLGKHLVNIGFDVFNQANNHSLDKGAKGIISTLDFWRTQPQAQVIGIYRDEDDYNKIRTVEKNGISFAFIGMTELTNGLNLPNGSPIVLMQTSDEQKIKDRIEKAKEIADVVVINVHWGVEYTHTPNNIQRNLAKKMVDWGADIILGHHPHVIQPVEYITRNDGTKGIVVYSLGNFISAQSEGPRMIGGMLDITITKGYNENKNGNIEIANARFIPVVTHYGKGYSNIKTYPFSSYTKEQAQTHGVRQQTPEFGYDYIKNTVENVIDKEFLTPYK